MSSLFELTAELRHLLDVIELADPSGELPVDLATWLDTAQGSYDQKVEGYCSVIGELEALAKAREEEAKRVRALAEVAWAKADRLKVALKDSLLKLSTPKVETTRYKVWVQTAGGKLPLQVIEEEVPHDLKKVELVTDKEKIRAMLEDGAELPYARLLPRSQVLRIK